MTQKFNRYFVFLLRRGKKQWLGKFLAVWQDLAIYWTLGNFLKPLATINLPKSPKVLGNFCVDAKILNFSSEIIFGQPL